MKDIKLIRKAVLFLTILFVASVSFSESRFAFNQNNDKSWVATTQTQSKDGLGQMLRELKIKPNWSDSVWKSEIKAANPEVLNDKNQIVQVGKEFSIPINALRNCEGYQELQNKLNQMALATTAPVTPEPPVSMPAVTTSENPPPAENHQTEIHNNNSPHDYRFSVALGGGIGQMGNDDVGTGFTTDLASKGLWRANISVQLNLNPRWDVLAYLLVDQKKYKNPDNLLSNQEDDLFINLGLDLGFQLKPNLRLGLFAASKNINRTELVSLTQIRVYKASLINTGASLSWIKSSPGSSLNIILRPGLILAKNIDGIKWDPGLSINSAINWYPFSNNAKGFFTGLEYNYESQSSQKEDFKNHEGFLNLGYRL